MKKTIIALLLVAAAGTAIFFYNQKSKTNSTTLTQQEQIIGKWKINSYHPGSDSAAMLLALLSLVDPNTLDYTFDFRKNGDIIHFVGDSATSDTSRYEWRNENLYWIEDKNDSTGSILNVIHITKDSLEFRASDNTLVLFTKQN